MTHRWTRITCVLLLSGGLFASRALAQEWTARTGTGTDPLAANKRWTKGVALDELSRLLAPLAQDLVDDPARRQYYAVVVAAKRWQAIYLLSPGCLTKRPAPLTVVSNCDLDSKRIRNSPNLSVIGISTKSDDVEWSYEIRKRERLNLTDFLTYIAPTVLGGIAAAPSRFTYFTLMEPVAFERLPADVELTATVKREVNGKEKDATASKVFQNYQDEFISFGVGAGVREVSEVNLNLSDGSLTATDLSKLKTYGMLNLHPRRVDPHLPRTWNLPHAIAALEINTKAFNYGLGVGWRLPYIKDTSIAVAWIYALPELSDDAKGIAGADASLSMAPSTMDGSSMVDPQKREWKTIFMIQYSFPLPQSDKKTN